jgi:hypothetical protein
MRNLVMNAVLAQSLSHERLGKYLATAKGDLDAALFLYERNMRLASAFYVPLQCLEICLRNRLHGAMTHAFGADWFANGRPALLYHEAMVIRDLLSRLSHAATPVTPGTVVAELHFGFWVAMLGTGYDAGLWRAVLYRAFLNRGRRMGRSAVHGRMNALRRFRNRVAHYETIYERPLISVHAEMIEAIEWMCPDTATWTAYHSQVPSVIAGP